ncbi:hypothetical protein BurJ1DRAFT_4250 [Burkholderiales bacterium JOSHI_001]|nr:hypothetical protein BurJ1DRAFT_4250 [Burkholderiales bacterium JOSHI_001]
MVPSLTEEIAVAAARLVVDEGMEYASAKRRAARDVQRQGARRPELPSNEVVEDAVREHIALFCADTQAGELAALRGLALKWMLRLAEFRPHLGGAAWRGTATRLSALHLDLYCDDPKAAEIALINLNIVYDTASGPDDTPVLVLADRCADWPEPVTLFLSVLDHDDLRGALKPDARGRSWRGNATALQHLLEN